MTTPDATRPAAFPASFPERYHRPWDGPFRRAIAAHLGEDITILDVGSGRTPTVAATDRPAGCHYIGLDLSSSELAAAGDGAYDESVTGDIALLRRELVGRVDLIVSWQVLEHVQDLAAALTCMQAYLRPGGSLVAMFSGGRAAYAIANRALPHAIGKPLVTVLARRSESTNPVFPAYYDRCTASQIHAMMAAWSHVEVTPFHRGAGYLRAFPRLQRIYLAVESFQARRCSADWATHYLLVARS
ncbi:class I SAM-dependent methyltransferase [Patulibacter sp. S7RM1-6]